MRASATAKVPSLRVERRLLREGCVLLGAADMISVVIRMTLIQLATPDDMRGRVSAVTMMFVGASNELGEFERMWIRTANRS